ncbi:TATA-binding protein-associated factor mot1, partial [Tulasnella sp. 403]
MSLSRLDRLLLLLDTGSSPAVRAAAAKQVAQIAAKSVSEDVAADPGIDGPSTNVHVWHAPSSDWSQVLAVVSRLLPYLHSKSFDTRTAATSALLQICTLVPTWKPRSRASTPAEPPNVTNPPSFPPFSVAQLLRSSQLLLASSGKEFSKPVESARDVARARKEAMNRLGLGFFDNVGSDGLAKDLEKELADDDDTDVKMSDVKTDPDGVSEPPPTPAATIKMELDPFQTSGATPPPNLAHPEKELSRREMNRLKRKRKEGNAFVGAVSSQSASNLAKSAEAQPTPKVRVLESSAGPSAKPAAPSPSPETGASNEKVVIDPQKGGQVAASEKASRTIVLDVREGQWVWQRLVEILEVDLVNPNWEVRHGAAMALRDIVKAQGACGGMIDGETTEQNATNHENWCNQLAAKFLVVFVLDRFSDFVSDQMVAPVRETVSQSLASLLLHMPRRSILSVHNILREMILQPDFSADENGSNHVQNGKPNSNGRKYKTNGKTPQTHVWQVRHAGLLGMKYEVAVRNDLVDVSQEGGKEVLKGVVEAALLGLGDEDDDVRSVAASCLTPIVQHIVECLPDGLSAVMEVLWNCLAEMKDDLGSSVGAVMELLGKLVSFPQVIDLLSNPTLSRPLTSLAPILFPFFRHVIPNVRLAVVNTFFNFLCVPALLGDWISAEFIRLLFQNLIVEERSDVRTITFNAWRRSISSLAQLGKLEVLVPDLLLRWFSILMNPIGVALDENLFYRPVKGSQLHNVDKPVLRQDLSLVTEESVLRGRIMGCRALAYLMSIWPSQEWAIEVDAQSSFEPPPSLTESSPLAAELAERLIGFIESTPPLAAYHEMLTELGRISQDCRNMLISFNTDLKVNPSKIPSLPTELDVAGDDPSKFSLATAEKAVSEIFVSLKSSLGKTKRNTLLVVEDRRAKILAAIERYKATRKVYDMRVTASVAAAIVALRKLPEKKNPVIHGIMDGTKYEENADLQERSALSVVAFVSYIAPLSLNTKVNPAEKIIKNLCTFICADESLTPIFAESINALDGISSNKRPLAGGRTKKLKSETPEPEKLSPAKLQRRGALLAISSFGDRLGPNLFERLPKLWECMTAGLMEAYSSDPEVPIRDEGLKGQAVIDNLTVIQGAAPHLHADLLPHMVTIFPYILGALKSRYA